MLDELLTALSPATRSEDLAAPRPPSGDMPRILARPQELARSIRRRVRYTWRFYAMCALAGVGLVGAVLESRG